MKAMHSVGPVLAGLVLTLTAGVSLSALQLATSAPAVAQSALPAAFAGPLALTGKVSSQEEGAMEGVVVSAKRRGSTIMVSVDSDAQGVYRFPKDRLEPGVYDITMRAVGYVFAPTTATIADAGPAHLDLALKKATRQELALQLTNSEWLQSAPGSDASKNALLRCFDCHGLQRPVYSKQDADEMAQTVHRMSTHTANASPDFPFFLTTASETLAQPPSANEKAVGAYIASIDLSKGNDWPYPFKTIPRPTGKATQVIVTTYDLPGLAAPHDTLRDEHGNIWFSDFQEQFIGKLDPKTGKVTQYPVPISKPGFPTGSLMITEDKNGRIWECMMGQAQIARLDPKTGKVDIFLAPNWQDGDVRFTMIDALHSNVDGKLWTKTNGSADPKDDVNVLYQVDIDTGKFTAVPPPPGKGRIAAYGLVTDLDNNVYGLDNNPTQKQIWRTDAKTGETKYIDVTDGGGRRGHIDAQNRLWFSQFYSNRYSMLDPKTGKVTMYPLPIPFSGAYDIQYDNKKYAWGADMSTDLVQRLDVESGQWTSYLLPLSINSRHVDVQMTDNPYGVSSLWSEGQQNGKIVHVEPLTP